MSKIECHLVHGMEIRDGGAKTIDKLIPSILDTGLSIIECDYGRFRLWDVTRRNKTIAKLLAKQLHIDDVAIGHSNGCAILAKSLQQGAKFDKLILIAAALDKNFKFPSGVNEIHVFYSKKDNTVVLAKWFRKLVFWRNTFLWGEMGHTGYMGNDPRVTNHELKTRHSKMFSNKWIVEFADKVTDIING